jgi:hypothetical protein
MYIRYKRNLGGRFSRWERMLWRGSPQHSICSRLLLKSLDLSIVPFCGQFVGVVKAVEPPPQQRKEIYIPQREDYPFLFSINE